MPKKFNFLKDVYNPVAKVLKPVARPIIGALTNKAVEKIASFKTGGVVPGPRGKPRLIMAHGGEGIVPLNSKLTAGQKKIIANNKKKGKK